MATTLDLSQDEGIHAINVTPLVDIMLVLLVTFMTTTTLMQYPSLPLDLPKSGGEVVTTPPRTILLALGKTGLRVNGMLLSLPQTKELLAKEVAGDSRVNVVLRAEPAIRYQSVVDVVALVRDVKVRDFTLDYDMGAILRENN